MPLSSLLGGENFAFQHDTETFDRRIDRHGGAVEPQFVPRLDVRADDLAEIVGPGQGVRGMDQRGPGEIAGLAQPELLDQSRATE